MCLAQGHNTVTPVGIEPRTSRFGVRRSTTMPPRSLNYAFSMFTVDSISKIRKAENEVAMPLKIREEVLFTKTFLSCKRLM